MKVMLVNGSPHAAGTCSGALKVLAETFAKEGIETEIQTIPLETRVCMGCYACRNLKKCVIEDEVNRFLEKMKSCDGLILASPVHYAAASGLLTAFMDRAFFAGSTIGVFTHKPAAAVVCARRAGTTAALDQINKYFMISQMPVISGRYWNMVHGSNAEEALQDKEGIQNLRILARNMAWHLKCQEAGAKAGILPPETEPVEMTNFIR